MRFFLLFLPVILCSCTRTTYYIVRHAEKEGGTTMNAATITTTDVPLSLAGKERAELLRNRLQQQRIGHIYATGTIRAQATAKPLSDATKVAVTTYKGIDSAFVKGLKELKGCVLVVGHSNTVDDLVNGLMGKHVISDLPDSAYGDLFTVRKRGQRYSFTRDHFGN
ncbi:MAG TPA: phosphoglycerate mutase family protein [Chitinophagaceae bacterium]|nr:phosphoglycerate mutase family protein [Chitinophagaceae bacterium]